MTFLMTVLQHSAMLEQWTLCTVDDVPDDQFADQPSGLTNHPAWILGHLTYAMDNVTRQLGGDVDRDDSWYEPYRGGTKPSSNRADYPSKDVLIGAYTDSSAALRRAVRAAGTGKLEQVVTHERVAAIFPTLGRWTAHVLLAEGAFHTGQLSAWRRAKGLPSVFEIEGNTGRMAASALTV